MNDDATTIRELKRWVLAFSRERDWEQFHNPKDLALALVCEVGELLEIFRYRTNEEIQGFLSDPDKRQAIAHELADALWMVARLADVCDIDLATALREKLAEAGAKYPAHLARGRADKYTTYGTPSKP